MAGLTREQIAERQAEQESQRTLKHLYDKGIPVQKTVFKDAVNNADGTPENFFDLNSHNPSRRVNMMITPIGLVCEHKGKYIRVPDSNTIFSIGK